LLVPRKEISLRLIFYIVLMPYYLYILKCSDDTYYTGITVELSRRLEEHNSSEKGAKYTRGRRPVQAVYIKKFKNRSEASKQEAEIKKLTREQKIEMIKKYGQRNIRKISGGRD